MWEFCLPQNQMPFTRPKDDKRYQSFGLDFNYGNIRPILNVAFTYELNYIDLPLNFNKYWHDSFAVLRVQVSIFKKRNCSETRKRLVQRELSSTLAREETLTVN